MVRIIPVLLIKDRRCVKTREYKNPEYIGDPINIVKIFNEKEVDELIILDIATNSPDFDFIEKLAENAFMPLAYGGGIKKLEDAKEIFKRGFEKIVVNRLIRDNPEEIKKIIKVFGSQSIVASIDVIKNIYGKYLIYGTSLKAFDYIKYAEKLGVGEMFISLVHREGSMQGYDIDFYKKIEVKIPVIANGGAGDINDILELFEKTDIKAAAGGSFFVFIGRLRAVLITYPTEFKRRIDESMR